MSDESPSLPDLDWLAFAYLVGELPADVAAAFELRLADDQAAREALARAVELSAAVYVCEGPVTSTSQPMSRPRLEVASRQAATLGSLGKPADANPAWWRPLGWMTLGAAACLAILLGWSAVRQSRSTDATNEQMGLAAAALLWSESRAELGEAASEWPLSSSGDPADEIATDDAELVDPSLAENRPAEDNSLADAAFADAALEDQAPSWMVAGVTGATDTDTPSDETPQADATPDDAPPDVVPKVKSPVSPPPSPPREEFERDAPDAARPRELSACEPKAGDAFRHGLSLNTAFQPS